MTIIAYHNGILAGDSKMELSEPFDHNALAVKVFINDAKTLALGITGVLPSTADLNFIFKSVEPLISSLESNIPIERLDGRLLELMVKEGGHLSAQSRSIIFMSAQSAYAVVDSALVETGVGYPVAMGLGAYGALVAMHLGHNPITAIAACSQIVASCGGEVVSYRMEDLLQLPKRSTDDVSDKGQ